MLHRLTVSSQPEGEQDTLTTIVLLKVCKNITKVQLPNKAEMVKLYLLSLILSFMAHLCVH